MNKFRNSAAAEPEKLEVRLSCFFDALGTIDVRDGEWQDQHFHVR